MNNATRNAGAAVAGRVMALALRAFLPLLMAAATPAADVRLLHVDPTTVRSDGAPAGEVAGALRVEFTANGKLHVLSLLPQEDLGHWSPSLPARAAAFKGDVNGLSGSWASVTRIGNRWSGIWYDGGEYYGIDSAGALAEVNAAAAAFDPAQLLVYRLRDVVWLEISLEGDTRAALSGEQLAAELQAIRPTGAATRRLAVAVAGDRLLAQRYGADTEATLLAQVNMIDGLFTSQLGMRVVADSVMVYGGTGGPFSTTTDPDALLEEVSDWRTATAQHRNTGLSHLFTGRNLDGRVVGMAYVSALCSRRFAASLSESTTAVSFNALIAAHEIGHTLGAPHDGESGSACATTAPDYLMAPRINGSQVFSACSIAQMQPKLQSASCLNSTWLPRDGVQGYQRPVLEGGGGGVAAWQLGALALLVAARARSRRNCAPGVTLHCGDQSRANQSAR